jgi:hypothetical protein
MNRIDYKNRELNLKIVYNGPGLSGKTTNLQYIYNLNSKVSRSELTTLNTEEDRTIFFDFLPVELGSVHGFTVRLHLYTVPGQVIHKATRQVVLKGVDGVVFVADSSPDRMADNLESLRDLEDNLRARGKDIQTIPYVLQLNKRDVGAATNRDEMIRQLQVKPDAPVHDAIATMGMSVLETMLSAARGVLKEIKVSDLSEQTTGAAQTE